METYLYLAQVVISIALIALVIVQARSGGLGGVMGSDSAVYHTRRGFERTLFQATIGLSIVFFLLAIITLIITG